ncbi:FG-GAP repeat domain-containing protein [Tundrisphaera sp. TA3]|uniref:FG-GAP repeat domain-containing protein n=1 Tax=Tundrisphaera sp. TA3 TaxID=3435775 RepID=UPI003EBEE3BF
MLSTRTWLALASALLVGSAPALGEEIRWKKHDINPKSIFEAAGVADFDGDGRLDIVSGDTWYNAPDWTRQPTRKVTQQSTYMNDFANLPMDVNADGKMDFVTVSYFGKNVGWVQNPGKKGAPWAYHEIDLPGQSEAAVLVDLDGDGRMDVLPNTVGVVTWYHLEPSGEPKWNKHDLGKAAATHGVGTGDVNGDGRVDLLTGKGWFEAPADPKAGTWAWHPDWNLGAAGIQILARDVDGDGLSDVVYGMGHDYGLFWLKQGKGDGGKANWTKAEIDRKIASVHTLLWADLDGDGKAHELLTGKRVYAHEKEAGDTDASVIAWYGFDPATKAWAKHVIFEGQPAKDAPADHSKRDAQKDFAPGTAGTGLEMTAIDIDGDGDLDLVCPGKSGLYLFENLTKTAR